MYGNMYRHIKEDRKTIRNNLNINVLNFVCFIL